MALRGQPYLPLYVNDFMIDEKLNECSAESTGVYIRIMCLMHKSSDYGKILLKQKDRQSERQIYNFAVKLSRQMPYSIDVIERSLTELLEENVLSLDGDVLYQKRMVKDGENSSKRAESGKKGAEKTNSKKSFADEFAAAKPAANSENEIESENEYEIEERKMDSAERGKENLDFESFWSAYPKKVGKGYALKSWNKISPGKELTQKILSAVESQKHSQQWKKDDGQFIPNPATWLNQGRWEDNLEVELPRTSSYDINDVEELSHFNLPFEL